MVLIPLWNHVTILACILIPLFFYVYYMWGLAKTCVTSNLQWQVTKHLPNLAASVNLSCVMTDATILFLC